jgi:hypothetical protein
MKPCFRVLVGAFLLVFASFSSGVWAGEIDGKKGIWSEILPGLSLGRFNADLEAVEGLHRDVEKPGLILLRIDPDAFRFRLLSASELEGGSRSLSKWARTHGLVAAINAGMFWSDQRTSTGYLRNEEHLNQGRIHPEYGGFLVFNPRESDLPRVQIVDRYQRDHWRSLLGKYASVVQNYRLIGRKREIAWQRRGKRHTASCIAEDEEGRILFIQNQMALAMKDLGKVLLDLPLRIDVCIFTEGGHHAGLYLDTPPLTRMWPRTADMSFWSSGERASIPNVVGVEPRKRSPKWQEFGILPLGFCSF